MDSDSMTWQKYIDEHFCRNNSYRFAVITALNNGAILGIFENNCSVTEEELREISEKMRSNPDDFIETGIVLADEHHECRIAKNDEIVGTKDELTVMVAKTNHCMIAVGGNEEVNQVDLCEAVSSFVDYVKTLNF